MYRVSFMGQRKHSKILLCFVCTVVCLLHFESKGSCAYRHHLHEKGFSLHQLNELSQGFGVDQVEICTLGKCDEDAGRFVLKIPDAIGGFKVTHIASGAFSYNQNIVAVEISSNVCQIGRGAFCGCSNLVSVSMADSAFHAMRILGESFKQCVKLVELKLPSGLDLIDVRAFSECNSLREVRLPESCNIMVEDAFSDCDSLRSIYMGTVGSHGEHRLLSAFSGCPALEKISVNLDNPAYAILDGALYYKNLHAIVRCPPKNDGKKFWIRDGVSIVCPFAFEGCQFEEIVLPESLGGIGRGAFWGCTNLISVCVPAGVKVIDDNAFKSCSKLRFVVMNSNEMPMMGDDVFPNGVRVIMRSESDNKRRQGCSCRTTTQLTKQDVESVVFERHQDNGLCSEAKWTDLSQEEQALLSNWMFNSSLEGKRSIVTYVPVIVVRAKKFNLNFTGDLVVCNYEVRPGKWRQVSRKMTAEDEQVRQCVLRVMEKKVINGN